MRTIIAGSRTITNYQVVREVLDRLEIQITTVICGCAAGPDSHGRKWAGNGYVVPVELYPADWDKHGKAAGHIRNKKMAEHAECLIAFWDGKSKGTDNMINTAIKLGLYVLVFDETGRFISTYNTLFEDW